MKTVGHKELIAMLQRFQSRKEYAVLKKSCKGAVTEWRWATSQMLPELPHDDIVRGFKRPRWAKKQPRYGFLHGLDANGRVCCMRGDDLIKPDDKAHEQLLIHEDNGFWVIYFDDNAEKALLRVKWFEMKGDRWLRSLELGHYGVRESVLHWEGDRLLKNTWRDWSGLSVSEPRGVTSAKLSDKKAATTTFSYAYTADGELERVTEESGSSIEVKYQRVPKGSDLKSLLQDAEDMLVVEIPKRIKAARVRDTIYGLFLQYTGVDTDPGGFVPPMFLASEGLRQRVLQEKPSDDLFLWMLPELEMKPGVVALNWKHPKIDEKLHLVFQLTVVQPSPTNYGPVRKMFQRVCSRLNALDWNGVLKTTDDFVVIPFDTHGEMDLKEDFKASIPAEKLQLLMKRGRIPRMKLK